MEFGASVNILTSIAIRFSDPDFLKQSNDLAFRRRVDVIYLLR